MKNRYAPIFALVFAMVFGGAPAAGAAEVVVVEAAGIDLQPGQILDGAQVLSLGLGQQVSLVASDGRLIKLKGPSALAPAPDVEPPKGVVTKSLKDLISTRQADISSLGVVRSGEAQARLPEPWLVDVMHGGSRCIEEGRAPVLWRGSAATAEAPVTVAPADRSWQAQATWPEGADRLVLPDNLALQDRHTYILTVDGGPVQITVSVIPRSVGSDAAKAAWMVEMRCDPQAAALLAMLP